MTPAPTMKEPTTMTTQRAARFTPTEQRVLSAVHFATRVSLDEHARDWPNEPTPAGILLDVSAIVRAANVGRPTRLSADRAIAALHSLERRGLVASDAFRGMGGALRTWTLARDDAARSA